MLVDCPNCGGAGDVMEVRPACCGRTLHGACRGYCCIPEPYQEQCQLCGGSGQVEASVLQDQHPITSNRARDAAAAPSSTTSQQTQP